MNSEKNYELAILKLLEIIAILRKKQHKSEEIINEIGLSQSYFNLLFIIKNFDGISISEISQKMGISISNCSKAIENLVSLGLLERKNDIQDKRVSYVHLSGQGIEVTKQYKESLVDKLKDMLDRLDDKDFITLEKASNDLVSILLKLY